MRFVDSPNFTQERSESQATPAGIFISTSLPSAAVSQVLDVLAETRKGNRGALVFPGTRPGAMMGNVVMTQALRNAGVAASGHGFRSGFKGWARQHDVDELLSEFALAHVEGSATDGTGNAPESRARCFLDPPGTVGIPRRAIRGAFTGSGDIVVP